MEKIFERLKAEVRELENLVSIAGLLSWDQGVLLPPKAAGGRGVQMGYLQKLIHEKLCSKEFRRDLEALEQRSADLNSQEQALLRNLRRDVDQATRVPSDFVVQSQEHYSKIYHSWQRAKEEKDFSIVRDDLAKSLELSLAESNYFPEFSHPLDYGIDRIDPGYTVEQLAPIFGELKDRLLNILTELESRPRRPDPLTGRRFSREKQLQISREAAEHMGYSLTKDVWMRQLTPSVSAQASEMYGF
jgi:carboxypeptidase Taq